MKSVRVGEQLQPKHPERNVLPVRHPRFNRAPPTKFKVASRETAHNRSVRSLCLYHLHLSSSSSPTNRQSKKITPCDASRLEYKLLQQNIPGGLTSYQVYPPSEGTACLETRATPDDEGEGEGEDCGGGSPSNLDNSGLTLQSSEKNQWRETMS